MYDHALQINPNYVETYTNKGKWNLFSYVGIVLSN